jgi:hypothetical protein
LRLERNADLRCGIRLPAHVDGDLFVLADADRHEPAERVFRGARAHALRYLRENLVADRSAVE